MKVLKLKNVSIYIQYLIGLAVIVVLIYHIQSKENLLYILNQFDINRIYPNPFNPQVTIEYQISEPANIILEIYNIRGQTIGELKNEFVFPGIYSVHWSGSNHPSGIYFVILYNNKSIIRKKMILLK